MADYRLTIRRDTQANWASANPVLAQGEPGFETDTNNLKVGDGTSAWNALPYYAPTISSVASIVSAEVRANGTISAGDVVAYDGASGGKILAVAADASDPLFTDQLVLGVSPVSAVANDDISIVEYGIVGSIDTSAFLEGDILYLDKTVPGGLTSTRPTAPDSVIAVAVAVTAQNNGTLLVAPRIGGDIKELNDVSYAMTPSDGDVLTYNSGVWSSAASYANSDVDAHLNTSTATTGQVLSWDGADYDWADASSGGLPSVPGQSVLFDAVGDYINVVPSVSDIAGNNFTVEAWVKPQAHSTTRVVISSRGFRKGWSINLKTDNSWEIEFYDTSTFRLNSAAGASADDVWTHVAVERVGDVFTLYLDGVSVATGTSAINYTVGDVLELGGIPSSGTFWKGRITDFRIVLGTAIYQGNFTPPLEHKREVAGTSYLIDPDDLTRGGLDTVNGDVVADSDIPAGLEQAGALYTDADVASYLASASAVGVGIAAPARQLHVSEAMRLEPSASAPASPSAGDIFFNSTTNKLQCYDGTIWQDCF